MTKTVVCFRAGEGDYAVPVEHVREVRAGDRLLPLPAPRPGVVGLLRTLASAFSARLAQRHEAKSPDRQSRQFQT